MGDRPDQLDLARADAYGRSFGDVYDRWYDQVTDAEATADFVAARHPDPTRPVLELGVGTGRLAVPLARRGLGVVGLDASAEMLARCPGSARGQDGPVAIHRLRADMRALPFGGGGRRPFGSVLLGFNTLFNLPDEADQARLVGDLAGLVAADGVVVVEMLDLTPLVDGPERSIGRSSWSSDAVVVTATTVERDQQRLWGQHLEVSDDGVILRPWMIRWLTPDQLDGLANRAGLELAERYASWHGVPVGSEASTIVSVYRPR